MPVTLENLRPLASIDQLCFGAHLDWNYHVSIYQIWWHDFVEPQFHRTAKQQLKVGPDSIGNSGSALRSQMGMTAMFSYLNRKGHEPEEMWKVETQLIAVDSFKSCLKLTIQSTIIHP